MRHDHSTPWGCTTASGLSLRDVETILVARGVAVSDESIQEWSLRFGRPGARGTKVI